MEPKHPKPDLQHTLIDLTAYGRLPSPNDLDGPVSGIEEIPPEDIYSLPEEVTEPHPTMPITARLVEEAFATAQASALGAFFDCLVEELTSEDERDMAALVTAKRVLNATIIRIQSGYRHSLNTREGMEKLYVLTPVPPSGQRK